MNIKISGTEIVLIILSSLLTLIITIALVRWIAPSLLGIPDDMVLVQSSKEVPPFYEHIFNTEDLGSREFILKDPLTQVRAKPLYPNLGPVGPNDLLGFRNITIPDQADVIVIGDSQTYGNNVIIWENWPHFMEVNLPAGTSVYSMATGGWGALQYLYAFSKAVFLSPKVVIIAFYSGNDSLETFNLARSSEYWSRILEVNNLDEITPITPTSTPGHKENWQVKFEDGIETVFTPELRHRSNMKHPAIDKGYDLMEKVIMMIADTARQLDIKLVVTIIPTKEYVYSEKIKNESIDIETAYNKLVNDESERIHDFEKRTMEIKNIKYVDVANALKLKAMQPVGLYPPGENGHPVAEGYYTIAQEISPVVSSMLNKPEDGMAWGVFINRERYPFYLENGRFWILIGEQKIIDRYFGDNSVVKVPEFSVNELTGYVYAGHIDISLVAEPVK